ncbi:hypothetical protein ILUMI_09111 [Ignelater luminosus]|uniref:Uncharacterized protein n=1 Tax=Ignelater luminosus TaxID=2038154 RepID=A0A8K0GEU2_IGNLU|nr:hypothetical protein ILUMI_09111 [Ignelater luminosus]
MDEWMASNTRKPFDIFHIASLVGKVYENSFSMNNILSEFIKTGIYPMNQEIFEDNEFLSSFVTAREEAETSNTGGNQNTPTSSKSSGNNIVTLDEVRPLPKAPSHKIGGQGQGRKLGKIRILTITPGKSKLIEDKQTDCPILTHALKNSTGATRKRFFKWNSW